MDVAGSPLDTFRWKVRVRCYDCAMPESKIDEIVADLRAYEAWLGVEMKRVGRALKALAEDDVDSSAAPSTSAMLLEVFQKHGPTLSISEAYHLVRRAGWSTDSKDPMNVIRAAMARMVSTDELVRTDQRGKYALASYADGGSDADGDDFGLLGEDDSDRMYDARRLAEPDGWGSGGVVTMPQRLPSINDEGDDEPPF